MNIDIILTVLFILLGLSYVGFAVTGIKRETRKWKAIAETNELLRRKSRDKT